MRSSSYWNDDDDDDDDVCMPLLNCVIRFLFYTLKYLLFSDHFQFYNSLHQLQLLLLPLLLLLLRCLSFLHLCFYSHFHVHRWYKRILYIYIHLNKWNKIFAKDYTIGDERVSIFEGISLRCARCWINGQANGIRKRNEKDEEKEEEEAAAELKETWSGNWPSICHCIWKSCLVSLFFLHFFHIRFASRFTQMLKKTHTFQTQSNDSIMATHKSRWYVKQKSIAIRKSPKRFSFHRMKCL